MHVSCSSLALSHGCRISVPRRAATSPVLGIPPSRMSGSVVRLMTVGSFNGRGSGRFQFGRDKDASHATIPLRTDRQRSGQDDGDDQRNGKPIRAGWLWYQRRWRKEKWTSLFVAVARPVQAGAGQAERRPGAARPDCVPHATAADAGGNASLRDVQVNSIAVRISSTKTVLPCRQHHCWQLAKSRDLPIRRKIGARSAPQQVGQLGNVRRDPPRL
jgi:hypothetical protein